MYKETLNLPKTHFPMKAALAALEPRLLQQWEEKQLYHQIQKAKANHPKYIVHDGPPYANGRLHIGHAVNKILKDIVNKSKILSGFNAPFVPGWDCHGLPIELNVEKKLKSKKDTYTPEEFRAACREYATEQIHIQKPAFKRLGILADWERPYLTMDFGIEADTIRALGKCIESGHLENGLKPVHWCTACQSALAELEVMYQEKQSTSIDVAFEVIQSTDHNTLPGTGKLFIPIWTTTPWTLPANEAVAIGSQIEYVLIQLSNKRFLLAKGLYLSCLARYGMDHEYTVLGQYMGKDLIHLQLQHPLEARTVPLITSNHVSLEKGTGAVHTAPSHGPEDYALGMQHQLPIRLLVDEKGRYLLPNDQLHQHSVFKAETIILDRLAQKDCLLAKEVLSHSYPHCWRHKTPLIFRATAQWFLRLKDTVLHQRLKEIVNRIHWIPDWGKARMQLMLGGDSVETARPDWCLSRQRYWGVPLPFFIHKETGKAHPNTLLWIEEIAKQVEKNGIEAWYRCNPNDLLNDIEREHYYPLHDVLDVWFDSGVTHFTVLKKDNRLQYPADLYLEGADQFRGWFQSSLITSAILHQETPYRNLLVHGFTVDSEGQKMSKSLGNTVSLDKLIQQWGADVVRLWIASTDTRSEIVIGEETFQRTSEAYRRIRNTIRFLLANLHDFDPLNHLVASDRLLSLDRWLIVRANHIQSIIQEAYHAFNFPLVYQTIHHFCINELGSIYLSIIKDRQYTMQTDSLGRRSGQTALYHVAELLLRWLGPILSFTTEEAWTYLPGPRPDSIFLSEWYQITVDESKDVLAPLYQEIGNCELFWEKVIAVKSMVNHSIEIVRNQNLIGSALEAQATLTCHPDSLNYRLLKALEKELRFIFLTSSVVIVASDKESYEAQDIKIHIQPINASYLKCERCWHRHESTGKDQHHPNLCSRCIMNLPHQLGEFREYA